MGSCTIWFGSIHWLGVYCRKSNSEGKVWEWFEKTNKETAEATRQLEGMDPELRFYYCGSGVCGVPEF